MNRYTKRIAAVMAIAGLALLTGCGKSDPAPATPGVTGTGAPLGSPTTGTCVPISAQIPFVATNIYFSPVSIIGGSIPNQNQTVGTVTVGGAPAGGLYQRQALDGSTIAMNIVPNSAPATAQPSPYGYPPGYPTAGTQAPTTANATGVIQLSSLVQQDIMNRFGGGNTAVTVPPGFGYFGSPYGYNPYGYQQPMPTTPTTATQVCVSGMALNLGHNDYYLHSGAAYLYLNNTQHGYVLPF